MKQGASESPEQQVTEPSVSSTSEPPMFYCGCHGDSGHYLWREDGESSSWFWKKQPWGRAIDGGLQPFPRGGYVVPNGHARFTQEHGWSALSWWDNSIDTRPGSHSTFVVEGKHTAEAILAMARARFPWVFERFEYAIVLGGGDRSTDEARHSVGFGGH